MITFTQGNLLDARVEALVNTVNTVGVMGKGIALMFKERFEDNFRRYAAACKANEVQTGKMFVTPVHELDGPRWIINFPTKQHWRAPSRMDWIVEGLQDLRRFLIDQHVQSIAIPPLGAGNGGLDWAEVRPHIEAALADLAIDILIFEPTQKYQNVAKPTGVQKLTPARALIAELVRRYWVLGIECSLLEIQKLAWFLERAIEHCNPGNNPLKLQFQAHKYGPYTNRLDHLLNNLDGSYLKSGKRIADASPFDVIWFNDNQKAFVETYLKSEAKDYSQALEITTALIDGFQSPLGLELLATVDWLLARDRVEPNLAAVREGLRHWQGGQEAAPRKDRLFTDYALTVALNHLQKSELYRADQIRMQ